MYSGLYLNISAGMSLLRKVRCKLTLANPTTVPSTTRLEFPGPVKKVLSARNTPIRAVTSPRTTMLVLARTTRSPLLVISMFSIMFTFPVVPSPSTRRITFLPSIVCPGRFIEVEPVLMR